LSKKDKINFSFGLSKGDYNFKPHGFVYLSNRDGYQYISSLTYKKSNLDLSLTWQKIQGNCSTGSSHHLDFLRNQVTFHVINNPKQQLIFGFGFDYFRLKSKFMDGTHKQFLYHSFIENHYKLNGNLILMSAIRFDHHPITEEHLTPKISLIYSFKPGHSLRFSWGRAFKNPSLFQVYKNFCISPVCHKGNKKLDAEKIDVFELAYQAYFKTNFYFSFSSYYNIYHDILVSRSFFLSSHPYSFQVRSYNDKRMYQYGFETEFSWDITDMLTIKCNYSYLHLDKDRDVIWGPLSAHQINLGIIKSGSRFFGAFWYHWQSEGHYSLRSSSRRKAKIDHLPSYNYATINLGYKFSKYTFSFLIENVFNDKHRECIHCSKIGTYFTFNFSINF